MNPLVCPNSKPFSCQAQAIADNSDELHLVHKRIPLLSYGILSGIRIPYNVGCCGSCTSLPSHVSCSFCLRVFQSCCLFGRLDILHGGSFTHCWQKPRTFHIKWGCAHCAWLATAFAGLRLSALRSLHSINLLCYVMMQLPCATHSGSMSLLGCVADTLKLVPFNAVLPMLLNVWHEARQRAKFVEASKSGEPVGISGH